MHSIARLQPRLVFTTDSKYQDSYSHVVQFLRLSLASIMPVALVYRSLCILVVNVCAMLVRRFAPLPRYANRRTDITLSTVESSTDYTFRVEYSI